MKTLWVLAPRGGSRGCLVKTEAEMRREAALDYDAWRLSLKAMTAASMALMKHGGEASIAAAVAVIERAGCRAEVRR